MYLLILPILIATDSVPAGVENRVAKFEINYPASSRCEDPKSPGLNTDAGTMYQIKLDVSNA